MEIVGVTRLVTVRLAVLLAEPAVGVWVVVTPEVLLGLGPTVLLVTLKVTLQLLFDGMVMPLKVSAVAPAVSVDGLVPAQLPPTAPPAAVMFTSVSLKDAFVSAVVVLLLERVRVTVELPPEAIDVGLKTFPMVGGPRTVRLAVLLPVPAVGICVVVMPEVAFGCTPAVLLVTVKITVQLLFAGMVMPLKLSPVAPAVSKDGVVPTQVPLTAPPAAVMFESVSVNAPPVRAMLFPLESVKVTVEVPPD